MEPAFTIWTVLLTATGFVGVIISFAILKNNGNFRSNWPIALLILGFSLILFQYVFFWTGHRFKYPYLYFFDSSWYLAFGPLLYTYFIKLYKNDYKTNYFHFVPAFLCFVLSSYYLFKTNGFFNTSEVSNELLFQIHRSLRNPWLIALLFFFYLWVIRDSLKLITTPSENGAAQLRKNWISVLLKLYCVFIFAYLSYYVLVNFSFFNKTWDYLISLTMAIGIFTIGFFVLRKSEIFNGELMINLFLPKKDNGYKINESTLTEFYEQLIIHVETQKPYRNNELRLIHLADEMGLSFHLLSQVINEKSGGNFNHFINSYRLKEASELLKKNEELNIKSIYFDVGFNNKTTFYNLFKKEFGCTPAQYREQLFKK